MFQPEEVSARLNSLSMSLLMGIATVAVYSEPDFRSQHVLHADEAVLVGGARPAESYLDIEKIVNAAEKKDQQPKACSQHHNPFYPLQCCVAPGIGSVFIFRPSLVL